MCGVGENKIYFSGDAADTPQIKLLNLTLQQIRPLKRDSLAYVALLNWNQVYEMETHDYVLD